MSTQSAHITNEAPVQMTNVSGMTDAQQAAGAIEKMKHDASAEKVEGIKAQAAADDAAREAAGIKADTQSQLGDVDSATEFNLGAFASVMAEAAAPGASLVAAAAGAVTGISIYNHRTSSSSGESDDGKGTDKSISADDWVMGRTARQAKALEEQQQPAAQQEGYIRRINAENMPQAHGDLDPAAATTVNAKGISYFTDGSSSSSSGNENSIDLEELLARSTMAEASLAGVTGLKMTSGMMSEAAFGFAERQSQEFQPEVAIQQATPQPMGMAA